MMKIKTTTLTLVIFFSIIITSTAQSNFSIDAKVDQLKTGDKIFLIYQAGDKNFKDSAFVKGGQFSFKGYIDYPIHAGVYLNRDPNLSKGDKAPDGFRFFLAQEKIKMTSSDSLKNIRISGSEINQRFDEIKQMQKKNDDDFQAFAEEVAALPPASRQDSTILKPFLQREKQLLNDRFLVSIAFANKHPESYLSLIYLSTIATNPELAPEIDKAYQKLSPWIKNSPLGKQLQLLVTSATSIQVGNTSPDFEQLNTNGKTVRLSDFRGKYVLIDFWASWCGPCRAENPNLVTVYKTFNSRGFEILGVSLDKQGQEKAWLKAIEKDNLSWTQVSDLKGWDNAAATLYGVRVIPANFLIDPSGKIIARDLRGNNLKATLEKLFP